jgi:transcriptional regulator with GAF, ATPase, and Fis domain
LLIAVKTALGEKLSGRPFQRGVSPMTDLHAPIYVVDNDASIREPASDHLETIRIKKNQKALRSGGAREMVGASPAFDALLNRVAIVAPTDSTVLILGETGTGKELAARAIHARSHRSPRPMVTINCAAIQPTLLASELFGHEKGSFTGALHQRLGRFELAEGGTVFLDEIGDLAFETQIALLRVLQEREFERVGGNRSIRVDVRVIAATSRDLNAAIAAGTFRSDLFYRLNVFPIHVPPLRERKADIPVLVDHFLRAHAIKLGRRIRRMDDKTLERLKAYSWPGNIRELHNVIERWAILSESDDASMVNDGSWVPREDSGTLGDRTAMTGEPVPGSAINLRAYLETIERNLIGRTMTSVGGNQSEAARRLGLSRGSLLERLKKYRPTTA